VSTPERRRAVLEERARQLARAPEPIDQGERLEGVVFSLGGERFMVESRLVTEVARVGERARLPGAGWPVAALTAWRGELLTLHDLREQPSAGTPLPERAVVLGGSTAAFALLADQVEGVRALPVAAIRSPGAGRKREFVRGVTDDAVLILDAEAMLRAYRRESDQ
jgi:purine-binding chemotaxis protein CheW